MIPYVVSYHVVSVDWQTCMEHFLERRFPIGGFLRIGASDWWSDEGGVFRVSIVGLCRFIYFILFYSFRVLPKKEEVEQRSHNLSSLNSNPDLKISGSLINNC